MSLLKDMLERKYPVDRQAPKRTEIVCSEKDHWPDNTIIATVMFTGKSASFMGLTKKRSLGFVQKGHRY